MRQLPIKSLNILGTRGIPAAHGGFESFVQRFAPYMHNEGWQVTVYCQGDEGASRRTKTKDTWEGINRIHINTRSRGTLATMEFDLLCVLDVLKRPGLDLVLGYNTAVFNILQRLAGRKVILNMDGIEWKRRKWGAVARAWFWINEWVALRLTSVAIADHPQIAQHLIKRGARTPVVIPYGADVLTKAEVENIASLDLLPNQYFLSIARIEPENSILEIVTAFVNSEIEETLVILGNLKPDLNKYHAEILSAARGKKNILFPGAIYHNEIVNSLRYYCTAYIHGHQVGGTNPSLVEALGAGSPIIAHDNVFNRWTAGAEQKYFLNETQCIEAMRYFASSAKMRALASRASRTRHVEEFTYKRVHEAYRNVAENVRKS